jgi:hypothetical protein
MGMGVGATVRKVEIDYPKKTETEFLKFLGTEIVEKNTLEPSDHEIDTKILKTM